MTMNLISHFKALLSDLKHFPWRTTYVTLRARFSEDRLGITAASLTFTTLIALVPFFALMLAMFTAFPVFGKFQSALQQWLIESLVPDHIAKQVLGYLTQFAAKASRLGWAGLVVLVATAVSLVLTIDRTLNTIWRVRKLRPWGQRVLVYWSALTLGPVLLGASLSASSYAISASRGLVGTLPGGVGFAIDVLQWMVLWLGTAAIYRFVPNTNVHWRHAFIGGLFVCVALELARKLLAVYISSVPSYSIVYGAFATLPILLIWVYAAWLIVLFGAVIAAYLPSMLAGVQRRGGTYGWSFQLALEVLEHLFSSAQTVPVGLTAEQLATRIGVDSLELQTPLEALIGLNWVARLEPEANGQQRYVVLTDLGSTRLRPLAAALLLSDTPQAQSVLNLCFSEQTTLADVIAPKPHN
jgi:membrane protein